MAVAEVIPCPTNEGASLYLTFPSGHIKPYEEVLTFLRKGTDLLKYGRHGHPKWHPFKLSNDDTELQWESKKGQVRRVLLSSITRWQTGQETPVFMRFPEPKYKSRSFSIFYLEDGGLTGKPRETTLDVICSSAYDYEMWFWGMQVVIHYPPHNWSAPPPGPMSSFLMSSQPPMSARDILPQRRPVGPPQLDAPSLRGSLTDERSAAKPTPKSKRMPGLSVMVGSVRSSGPLSAVPAAARREAREMGDLYVWGNVLTTEADDWAQKIQPICLEEDQMRLWQQSPLPVLALNASSMDVLRVACAPRHAALITRKGELYTWGYGKNGNLGHGWCTNLASPRLVTRMSGKGVHTVSCSEGATAVISADKRLFMWGSGLAGQLGNGFAFPVAEPMPVMFPGLLEDVRVDKVSCGPYHTAAVTEGGLLFTWGNGLFGKLGHGTHESEYRPRLVQALEEKVVMAVSCGYWHTAAVAVNRNNDRTAATPLARLTPPASMLASNGGFGTLATHAATVPGGQESALCRSATHLNKMDLSSSGSELLGVVSAANAAANSFAHTVHGHFCQSSETYGAPLLGHMRSELFSSSVTSLDNLRSVADDGPANSGSAGALYTWGGDFSWNASPKRDHHGGCLGLGDKEGRLLPTRVRGDMDKHGVVQVACGWNLTVALSADGRVYQMGSTGASTNAEWRCAWEGALVPTRVDGDLFDMFVDEVACGMHHVVVVATKVQANGEIADEQRRMKLLTWGRSAEGQLGVDLGQGSASTLVDALLPQRQPTCFPQVVTNAVDGKRMLNISAGGNHTMAVIEHDPRVRRSHPAPLPATSPLNGFGGSTSATPSAGGGHPRTATYATLPFQVVGAVTTGVRDVGAAASGLLGLSSPFQLSQSLPLTAAAAGLQSLQQMVVGGPRAKLTATGSNGGGGAVSDSSRSARNTRRHQSSRLVAIPTPTQSAYAVHARSDANRTDLRRSATRLHHHHHNYLTSSGNSGSAHALHMSKSLTMSAYANKILEAAPSESSGGMLSQRSSPPLMKGDGGDSRSISPTSSSLFEVSSTAGDFHASAALREATRARTRAAVAAAASAAAAAGPSALGQRAAAAAAVGVSSSLDQVSAMGPMSQGGNSVAETAETTDVETDSYFHGGRSLDMVPEQSEESPGSASCVSRIAHHVPHHAHANAGQPPYGDAREVALLGQGGAQSASQAVVLHPRVAMLAHPNPGVTAPGAVENLRSSLSTMDSTYTTAGSLSSGMSPSGVATPSPDTPDEAGARAHAGHRELHGVSFVLPEDAISKAPEQAVPYGAHPLGPQHQAPASPLQPAAAPTGPWMLATLPHQEAVVRPPSISAAAGGNIPSVPNITARSREVSISAWAQPSAAAVAAAAAAAVAAGLAGAGGSAAPQGAFPSMYRNEPSLRPFASHGPDLLSSATVSGGGDISLSMQRGANVNLAINGGRSGRRSRGHSRHQSYDSLDLNMREGDVGQPRGTNTLPGGFDLAPPPSFHVTGGSGVHTPPRLTSNLDANLFLKQENDMLNRQVEALKHQVTMLTQAAAYNAAAKAAGDAAAAAGAGAPAITPPYPPPMPAPQSGAATSSMPALAIAGGPVTTSLPQHPLQGGAVAGAALPLSDVNAATVFVASATTVAGGNTNDMASIPSILASQSAQLHHAMSASGPILSGGSYGPVQPLGPPPSTHGLPPLGPGPGPGSGRNLADRQTSAAGGPPVPMATANGGGRHRRCTSVDVSSLIATRDGIGPAKEYLAPATGQPLNSAAPSPQPDRGGPLTCESAALAAHHATAPVLESLRHAHPGMSLAKAALAEADEEGDDDDNGGDDGMEDVDEEAEGREGDTSSDMPSVSVTSLRPADAHGSLRRRMYVSQQKQQAQSHPPQALRQPSLHGRTTPSNMSAAFELRSGELTASAVDIIREEPANFRTDASTCSASSGDTSITVAEGTTVVHEADEGPPLMVRRERRNAMIENPQILQMQLQQLQQQQQMQQSGSGGGMGSGRAAVGTSIQGAHTGGLLPLRHIGGDQYLCAPGVFVWLRPGLQPGSRPELYKMKFSRRLFNTADASQWWNQNRQLLDEHYHVTAAVKCGNSGGSRTSTPNTYPASPCAAPPPGHPSTSQQPQTVSLLSGGASHARVLNADPQGPKSGSSGAAIANNTARQLYATSTPIAMPAHRGGGSGGSGVGIHHTVIANGTGGSAAAAASAYRTGGLGATPLLGGGGGDPYASWADQTYDDHSQLAAMLPPLAATSSAMPPRHHRSRSGSRNASGGAQSSNGLQSGGLPLTPSHHPHQQQQQWPSASGVRTESVVLVTMASGAVGGGPVGPSVGAAYIGGPGGGGSGQPYHHRRTRSGGAGSSMSSRS